LIGTVANTRVLFVHQQDVAEQIAVKSEDGREAVWHSVVEPPRTDVDELPYFSGSNVMLLSEVNFL
jgi:hypothetical protein